MKRIDACGPSLTIGAQTRARYRCRARHLIEAAKMGKWPGDGANEAVVNLVDERECQGRGSCRRFRRVATGGDHKNVPRAEGRVVCGRIGGAAADVTGRRAGEGAVKLVRRKRLPLDGLGDRP